MSKSRKLGNHMSFFYKCVLAWIKTNGWCHRFPPYREAQWLKMKQENDLMETLKTCKWSAIKYPAEVNHGLDLKKAAPSLIKAVKHSHFSCLGGWGYNVFKMDLNGFQSTWGMFWIQTQQTDLISIYVGQKNLPNLGTVVPKAKKHWKM